MPRRLYLVAAIVFGCIASVASAMTPQKPKPSSALTAHVQTPDLLQTLATPEMPPPTLELAPPMITMPDSLTKLAVTYLRTSRGNGGPRILFPSNAATAPAVRRIASRSVSSGRGRCARTMREAMGWGLGDAHQWVKLPQKGFSKRVGQPAKPGDIVVWPFTFGRRGSQHIGIAVDTDNGMRLLSNLSGNICLSALAPGYRAFYKTCDAPPAPLPLDPSGGLAKLTTASATEG